MKSVVFILLLIASFATSQTVVQTLDAPDTNITGLACGAGSLWALDQVTSFVYRLDPATGSIQDSWRIQAPAGLVPTGIGFGNNMLHVAMFQSNPTNGDIYQYTVEGIFVTSFDALC